MANKGYMLHHTSIRTIIAGVDIGLALSIEGGDSEGSESKSFVGGMLPQISLGSIPEVSNVTVTHLLTDELRAQLPFLREKQAISAPASATRTFLDHDKVSTGQKEVWTGTLLKVAVSGGEQGGEGAQTVELEIATDGTVGS